LPSKAWKRQMPAFLRRDDGIFEDDFIDERRKGLEQFINKYIFILFKKKKEKRFFLMFL
jgi:hypothetical protein